MSTYPLASRGRVIGTPHAGTHRLGNWQSDNAIDVGVPVGTPVVAVADGTIAKTGGSGSMAGRFGGYNLTLDGGGTQFFYTHLQKLSVRPGETVRKGQVIGTSGSANGVPHLHFGISQGDPRSFASGDDSGGPFGFVGDAAGAVGGAVSDVAGGAVDAGDAVVDFAKDPVGAIIDGLGGLLSKEGPKIGLYVVLVLGGTALAMVGLARTLGVNDEIAAAAKVAATRGAKR